VSQYSSVLSPIAVAAVTRLVTPESSNVDLRDIRVVKKVGGTIEDTELIHGVVLNQTVVTSEGGPTRIEKAKIGLIQFQLSPPKPDVSRRPSICRHIRERHARTPFHHDETITQLTSTPYGCMRLKSFQRNYFLNFSLFFFRCLSLRYIVANILLLILDGQSNCGEQLRADRQDYQRGEDVPPQHLQADQEDWLQCPPHPVRSDAVDAPL
jgi:hypothetical protein